MSPAHPFVEISKVANHVRNHVPNVQVLGANFVRQRKKESATGESFDRIDLEDETRRTYRWFQ